MAIKDSLLTIILRAEVEKNYYTENTIRYNIQFLLMSDKDKKNKQTMLLSNLLKSALQSGKKKDQLLFQSTMVNRYFYQVYLMALDHDSDPDQIVEAIFHAFFEHELPSIANSSDDQIDHYFLALTSKHLAMTIS